MGPMKFYDDHQAIREINGPRPSPLKINKNSHLVHKPSTSSSSSSGVVAAITKHQQQTAPPSHQEREPVIIYTHSPKIIHTQARDFMSLVQKLTGFSSSDYQDLERRPQSQQTKQENSSKVSSSAVSGETKENHVHANSSSVSPVFYNPTPNISDIPLFTPNLSNFFHSPGTFFRYQDSLFSSPSMASSISPSTLEFMKGFPPGDD